MQIMEAPGQQAFPKSGQALAGPRRFEMVQKIAISGYGCQCPE
jgi:hypothetical protein